MAKILICDDSPNQVDLVSTFLLSLGHEVDAAADPTNLMVRLGVFRPDAVIMDMQMPAGGGPQAVKNMKRNPQWAKARIVFCSGMPIDQMQKWFPLSPRFRYLKKPVDLNQLKEALDELLALPS